MKYESCDQKATGKTISQIADINEANLKEVIVNNLCAAKSKLKLEDIQIGELKKINERKGSYAIFMLPIKLVGSQVKEAEISVAYCYGGKLLDYAEFTTRDVIDFLNAGKKEIPNANITIFTTVEIGTNFLNIASLPSLLYTILQIQRLKSVSILIDPRSKMGEIN